MSAYEPISFSKDSQNNIAKVYLKLGGNWADVIEAQDLHEARRIAEQRFTRNDQPDQFEQQASVIFGKIQNIAYLTGLLPSTAEAARIAPVDPRIIGRVIREKIQKAVESPIQALKSINAFQLSFIL